MCLLWKIKALVQWFVEADKASCMQLMSTAFDQFVLDSHFEHLNWNCASQVACPTKMEDKCDWQVEGQEFSCSGCCFLLFSMASNKFLCDTALCVFSLSQFHALPNSGTAFVFQSFASWGLGCLQKLRLYHSSVENLRACLRYLWAIVQGT